ncbi:MAG: enoyl-CoA hydratase family protein [Candidatus Dormibacteria bacterium]|jgi:enoyl-CoA hydratase
MTDTELVHLAIEHGVATVTLDSPHNRNALSRQLVAELTAHVHTAAGNAEVRAVVLTHTGTTFCAGADLSEASTGPMGGTAHALLATLRLIVDVPQPVIARIDGNVRAGGVGLVGACDIAVAGPRSTFAITEARIGVAAAVISVTVLPRLDARSAARYYLTGATFDATEAERIGLVTIATDDLDGAVASITADLRKGSPQGLVESKRLANRGVREAIERYGEEMVELSARLFASEEAHEGMTAFLERRQPRWSA